MTRPLSLFLRLAPLVAVLASPSGNAAPVLRHTEEVRGDMLLIGNTLAHDCRYAVAPLVGTVVDCGSRTSDSGVDIFWRADSPSAGQANADDGHTSGRTRAVLSLPAGATVTFARLYWAAESATLGADLSVTLQGPGGLNASLTADASHTATASGQYFYQSGVDVTALVQQAGPGAYTVSGVSAVDPVNRTDEVNFAAWSLVIFYELTTDPPRNLTLFDGLDQVENGETASATVSGFTVPNTSFGAKLAVIAYEGDNVVTGDRLRFNGTALSDGLGGTSNFFNSTRTRLGTAVTVTGDLPQLTGGAASMSGLDLDVVDVTAQLAAGDTSASIEASSTGDTYLLGALVTSISTLKPLFTETVKSVSDLNGGQVLSGDQLAYTISTHNSGSDTAVELWLEDVLPAGVTYLPGSLEITSGPNAGVLTDLSGDDAGEYEAGTGRVVVRLGTGATATQGGALGTSDGPTGVRFLVTVDAGAVGIISNQAVVHATGALSGDVLTFVSGIPGDEGEPTRFQVAPNTVINTGPAATTQLTGATLTFSSPSPGATFVCRRDGAAFAGCTSPMSYAGLSQGSHTFEVAAIDGTEQDATPASRTWTVDSVAPDTTIVSGPAAVSTTTAAAFTFSSSESGSSFQCRLDAGAWGSCTSPVNLTVGQGAHTWWVRATDAAGNQDASPASHAWSVDSLAPDTTIVSGPAAVSTTTSAAFTFSASEAGTSFQCRLDAGVWGSCTSPVNLTVGQGAHTWEVRASDSAGNQDPSPASHAWSVDSLAPDTTIVSGPAAVSTSTTAAFTFTSSETGSTFVCRLDAGAWGSCSSPVSLTVGQGDHTWEVRATDAAGNQDASPASHSWSVDSLPPAAPVITVPAQAALLAVDTVTVSGTAEPGTQVAVRIDTVLVGTAPADAAGDWTLADVGPLSDGDHGVEAIAQDTAGNPSAPGTSSFRTDTTPPETSLDSTPGTPSASDAASFSFSADEAPATFFCSVDAQGFAPCTSPLALTGLTEGQHQLAVYAVDEAGNADASPASHSWTVDTVPPQTTLHSHPGDPSASRSATFTFSSSESPATFQCRVDGAAFSSCTTPATYNNLTSAPHTFEVRALDAAGNVDATPASFAWTVNGDRDGDDLLDLDEVTHGTDPDDPDTDDDGLPDGLEVNGGRTSPTDADSDDDGLLDGSEDANADGLVGSGETDPAELDTDGDGLSDGLELGLTEPEGSGVDTDLGVFVADQEPITLTDPLLTDTDSGGVWDGYEDRDSNGRVDPGETDPNDPSDDLDADGDGVGNEQEWSLGLDPFDADTDDDGLADGADGVSDTDGDGLVDAADPDSDNDGLPDGLEAGVTAETASPDTDQTAPSFVADQDPSTTTDPRMADSDGDGLGDGDEDLNHDGRYDPEETDPLNPDTDSGGLADGLEREHGLDPTWDGDDWGVGGSGCSSSGSGLFGGALLLLVGLLRRSSRTPRRLGGAGLAGLIVAMFTYAPDAAAQTTAPKSTAIDLQQFRPAPGGSDLLGLHSALVAPHFQWSVGLVGSYGTDPLTLTNPITGASGEAVVAHQTTLDLYGSIGLFGRFELGVVLPLTLQGTQSELFDGQTLQGAGLGDLRLVPKARIVRLAGIELAAAVPVVLPTGGERSFLGGGGVAVEPQAIAEWAPGPLRVIANLGLRFRRTEQLQNLHVGHALTYGAGLELPMELPVVGDLALGGTVQGSLGLIQNDPEERPLELLVMGRWTVFPSWVPGLRVVGGGGPGLTRGYGTPRFRLFLGVDWAPGSQEAPRVAPKPRPD